MFELAGGKRTLPAYSFAYLLRYANVEDFLLGLQHFFFFFFSNSTSVLWREVPSSSPLSAWRMEHHKPPGATKEQIQCPETDPKLTELRCYCARPRYKRSTNTSPRRTHGHTLTLLPLRVGEREKGLTFIDWAFRRRQRQIDWIILINIQLIDDLLSKQSFVLCIYNIMLVSRSSNIIVI